MLKYSHCLETVVGSGNSDDTYLNIKMDDSTHQYTFGTPVNPTHLEKNLSMLTSATGMESWHSLSTAGTVDDRGKQNMSLLHCRGQIQIHLI